jgi:hypothetical protein
MTTPEKLPEVARKRPAVNISLSKGALAMVDKRAKEAGLSRSRIIEAAILATWGENDVPDGHKGGFVQCQCGAGAFVDGGPDLDLTAPWECKRCRDKRLGLRVPTYDEVARVLNVPEVAPLLKSVRGWSAEGSRRFITVVPNGERLGLARAIRELDWKCSGYCPPRVGLAQGELELVWTVD